MKPKQMVSNVSALVDFSYKTTIVKSYKETKDKHVIKPECVLYR